MRLIDAEEFEAVELPQGCTDEFASGAEFILEKLDAAPTVDAEPVRHAHWIPDKKYPELVEICSWCGDHTIKSKRALFCRHCGAKMDEEDEHDEKI